MRTLEDEWHVLIKAYKFIVFFEICKIFCIIIYCVSILSLHTDIYRVYQLYMLNTKFFYRLVIPHIKYYEMSTTGAWVVIEGYKWKSKTAMLYEQYTFSILVITGLL